MVFALFKPFLNSKLSSRIIFHGTDRESLYKYISKECLTSQYGGTLKDVKITGKCWLDYMLKLEPEYKGKRGHSFE